MSATVTVSPITTSDYGLEPVSFSLYRDIHKAIRSELFSVTTRAGRIDPSDRPSRAVVAEQVHALTELLLSHAEHEDAAIEPVLVSELPQLAERIEADHESLERKLVDLESIARDAVDTTDDHREATYALYLALASFTGDYLAHQDVEERVVMPALEQAVGIDVVMSIHGAILASIPPEMMADSLSIMLPVMNIDDRAEMLGGMRASAPPEAFEGVWGLAGSVLSGPDHAALAARLGLD
jgi:hypothetical protein